MHKRLVVLLCLALAPAALLPAAAEAARLYVVRGEEAGLSLDAAVAQVQRETGGRVLSADADRRGGRTVYRIKVLTPSGHVRVYLIDARSGERL